MAEIGEKKLGFESIANKSLTWVDIQKPTREKDEGTGRKLPVS